MCVCVFVSLCVCLCVCVLVCVSVWLECVCMCLKGHNLTQTVWLLFGLFVLVRLGFCNLGYVGALVKIE